MKVLFPINRVTIFGVIFAVVSVILAHLYYFVLPVDHSYVEVNGDIVKTVYPQYVFNFQTMINYAHAFLSTVNLFRMVESLKILKDRG